MLTLTRRRPAGRRRASTIIEFLFVLPIMLGLVFLSVDMGRMVMIHGALSTAAFSSAAAGAQSGTPGSTTGGDVYEYFRTSLQGLPMVGDVDARLSAVGTAANASSTPSSGSNCSMGRPYVVVEVEADIKFITPGIKGLLDLSSDTDEWRLATSGVAVCQVAPRAAS